MDEPIQSGRVLGGRYKLGERLGAGGWGAVYAAVQTDLGRPVAVKVLHTSVALSGDGLARFEREAKAAAALGHPNIAQVTDFQANPGEPPFLVLELLTGSTLGAIMKATPKLAPARIVWIAYQILAGLDVAHRAGIVHRDIKPDNVFLVAMPGVEDYVKLLDFGIAKLSGDKQENLTSTGTMLGSPAFMAPEQVRTSHVDHRVDIYAVGATMYLALTGRMPFDGETIHGLLLAITEQRPAPMASLDPTIDPALVAVVERAMHKDPGGRFASAGEMRAALEPWLGGVAAHASSTAHAPRPAAFSAPATNAMSLGAETVMGNPPVMSAGPPLGSPPPGSPPPGSYPPPPGFGTPNYAQPANNPYAAAPPNPNVNTGFNPGPNPQYGAPAQPQFQQSQVASGPPIPNIANSVTPQSAPAQAKSGGAVVGLLVVVVVLLLVVVGGGVAGFFYLRSPDGASAAAPSGAPAATGAAATGAASVAANGAPTNAAAQSAPGAPGAPGGAAAAQGGKPVVGAAGVAPAVAAPGAAGVAPAAAPGAAAAAPAIVTDAAAPAAAAPKKQFSGHGFFIGGGIFDVYDIDQGKAAINARGGAIGACFAASEFDPPDHQFTNWTFAVDPAGNVRSVGRTTSADPHPKFDACMIGALRTIKWPASKAGGAPHISFTSRTRDNP